MMIHLAQAYLLVGLILTALDSLSARAEHFNYSWSTAITSCVLTTLFWPAFIVGGER